MAYNRKNGSNPWDGMSNDRREQGGFRSGKGGRDFERRGDDYERRGNSERRGDEHDRRGGYARKNDFDRRTNDRGGSFERKNDFERRENFDRRSNDRRNNFRGEGFDRRGNSERRSEMDRHGNPPRTGAYREVPKAVFDGGDAPVSRERRPRPNYDARPPRAQFDARPDFEAEPPKDPVLRNAAARAARPAPVVTEAELPENLLVGRNPIREAIKTGHAIEKLLVAKGDLSGAARDIMHMALEAGVVVQEVERSRLDAIYPNHQGLLAYVSAAEYSTVEKIFENAEQKGEAPFIILLDGITDPHNLGAIIRSAECTGAHGVIVPERRSVGLTPACVKAAAGATEYMPVAKVTNLNRTIEELQARGVWVMAAAMDGETIYNVDLTVPTALVIGSEGDGVSALTLKKCDRVVSLPMRGHIDSLNASVAAGAMMYAVLQARS